MMKRIALSFLLASTLAALPSAARADHKSPLADAPAIRKRVELRDKRFEIGVAAGTTVNETFYHDVLLNAHLAFHITDWLAIGGAGLFNATALATGFHDELTSTLKNPADDDRAPNAAVAGAGMNKPSMILAGQVELTPFTGKFSIFGKLFAHYDFYVFGGPAYVTLVKANSATSWRTARPSRSASRRARISPSRLATTPAAPSVPLSEAAFTPTSTTSSA